LARQKVHSNFADGLAFAFGSTAMIGSSSMLIFSGMDNASLDENLSISDPTFVELTDE
jgi:hypothetical protein